MHTVTPLPSPPTSLHPTSSLRNGIDHVPLPSNAFILYRPHVYHMGPNADTLPSNVSTVARNMRYGLTDEHVSNAHALPYPGYRFRPINEMCVSKAVTTEPTPNQRFDNATNEGQSATITPPKKPVACDCAPGGHPSTLSSNSSKYKRSDHVPRPPNSFMLFRSAVYRKEIVNEKLQGDLSIAAGKMWKSLSDEQKAPWVEKALQIREEHAQRYPGYRFRPGNRMTVRGAKMKPKQGRRDEPSLGRAGSTSAHN